MSIRGMLNTTVDVSTQAQTKSPTGAASITWVPKASGVRARVSQLSADAVIAAGRLGYTVSHRVYVDTDQSLTIKDRIEFQGSGYEVREVNNAGGHLNRLWQIDCEKKPL